MAHDDHFHCYNKAGVRKDTFKRSQPGSPDLTFYSLKKDLADLVARAGGRASLKVLGTTPTGRGGRDILHLRLGKNSKTVRPKALFIGGVHAREWLGVSYTYLIAEWLVDHYPAAAPASDAERIAQDLLDNFHIDFVPMLNPDGHEYSVTTSRLWRKNSPSGDPRFSSSPSLIGDLGVQAGAPESIDLNRNFATPNRASVIAAGPNGVWSDLLKSDMNAGKSIAFETKALQDLMTAEKYQLVVDHHSFGCWFLPAPGDTAAPSPARFDTFAVLAKALLDSQAAKNPTTRPGTPDTYTRMQSARFYATLYPARFPTGFALMPGATDDFAYSLTKPPGQTLAFTIELPPMEYAGSPGFAPGELIIRPVFKSVLATSLALVKHCKNAAPTTADFDRFKVVP